MELRQLQYTLQIAAERNFSRAADKLHIAQPSLSQQLSKLEKELGVLLFQRNTSSVELTHAGEKFVEQAQAIIDAVELLRQEMSDISQLRTGRVVVGSMPITGAHLLPHVLPVFKSKYAEVEITLLEDSSMNLEKLTASGQTDLSLLSCRWRFRLWPMRCLARNGLIWQSRLSIRWQRGVLWVSVPHCMSLRMNRLSCSKKVRASVK